MGLSVPADCGRRGVSQNPANFSPKTGLPPMMTTLSLLVSGKRKTPRRAKSVHPRFRVDLWAS